jgi:hypothetical protein
VAQFAVENESLRNALATHHQDIRA